MSKDTQAKEGKNLGGRPRKEIDYKKLKRLCKIQCTGEECANILDIDYDTLNNHLKEDGHGGFSEYYKKNSAGGKASLRRRQYKSALKGSIPMQIWLGKQWLGQKDKQELEHTGDGITFNMNYGPPPEKDVKNEQ